MKRIKLLTLPMILSLLSGCTTILNEQGIVTEIKKSDSQSTISLMNEDGKIHTFTIENELVSDLQEGDKVDVTVKNKEVTDYSVENYNTDVSLSDIYFTISELLGGSDRKVVQSSKSFVESYQIEDETYSNGVAILPKANGDIQTVIIIETEQSNLYESVFEEIVDGMKATYENDQTLLSDLKNTYASYDSDKAILIVGDKQFKKNISEVIGVNLNE